jgi:hypothetical protein
VIRSYAPAKVSIAIAMALAGCSFKAGELAPTDATRAPDSPQPARDAMAVMPDAKQLPAFVQGAANSSMSWESNGETIAAQLTVDVTAGDVIAVYVSYSEGASVSSVKDTLDSTYTVLDTIDDSHNQQMASTAYAVATTSGSDTVTATLTGSVCCRVILVHEVSGLNAADPIDGHAALEQDTAPTTTDGVTSGSAMTAMAGDYIFAATTDAANTGGQVITAGTAEKLRLVPPVPDGNPTVSEDELQAAAGVVISTFTFSQSGGYSLTGEMAFKP